MINNTDGRDVQEQLAKDRRRRRTPGESPYPVEYTRDIADLSVPTPATYFGGLDLTAGAQRQLGIRVLPSPLPGYLPTYIRDSATPGAGFGMREWHLGHGCRGRVAGEFPSLLLRSFVDRMGSGYNVCGPRHEGHTARPRVA